MKKNLSNIDRIVRLLISAVFVVLFATGTVTGTAGIILLILAAVFTFTAVFTFCPIYASLGWSSLKKKTT